MKLKLVKCLICGSWRLYSAHNHCAICGAAKLVVQGKGKVVHINLETGKQIVKGIRGLHVDGSRMIAVARVLSDS